MIFHYSSHVDISVICDPDKLTDRGCCGAPDLIFETFQFTYPPFELGYDWVTNALKMKKGLNKTVQSLILSHF
ncbi:MAG TPA: hypothetical protein DD387_02595 [Lachnoclostridium sp.]|jgi:hypothetical protein|nr:hypothetical protein [Lachnoclostridium sp.]